MTINPLFSPHSNSDLFLLSALRRVNVARKPRFFDGAEGGCSNEERVEHRGRKEGRSRRRRTWAMRKRSAGGDGWIGQNRRFRAHVAGNVQLCPSPYPKLAF